jgi:hypothetical protein
VKLSEQEKQLVAQVGGGMSFVGVTNEAEARKRFEALRAAKR